MHPNSEADDNPCEPEKSEELQNVYDVSINEQSQYIFTFHEGILTVAMKEKNNKQVSHTDEVNYIIDHSQTPNMVPQTLHKNQEMTENCSQTMPQTDTANTLNADLLEYVCRLEVRMEKLVDIITGDMRELRSITELSFEIRSSRTLNENLSHKEEISRLKEKIKNQDYLISDLDTKLKELNNERNSLLTVIRILQVENQNILHYQRQQQVANLHANINHPPQSQQNKHVAPSAHINNLQQSLPTQTDQRGTERNYAYDNTLDQRFRYQWEQQQSHHQNSYNETHQSQQQSYQPKPQQKQQLLPQHIYQRQLVATPIIPHKVAICRPLCPASN